MSRQLYDAMTSREKTSSRSVANKLAVSNNIALAQHASHRVTLCFEIVGHNCRLWNNFFWHHMIPQIVIWQKFLAPTCSITPKIGITIQCCHGLPDQPKPKNSQKITNVTSHAKHRVHPSNVEAVESKLYHFNVANIWWIYDVSTEHSACHYQKKIPNLLEYSWYLRPRSWTKQALITLRVNFNILKMRKKFIFVSIAVWDNQ